MGQEINNTGYIYSVSRNELLDCNVYLKSCEISIFPNNTADEQFTIKKKIMCYFNKRYNLTIT